MNAVHYSRCRKNVLPVLLFAIMVWLAMAWLFADANDLFGQTAGKSITVGPNEGFWVSWRYAYDDPMTGAERRFDPGVQFLLSTVNARGELLASMDVGTDTLKEFSGVIATAGLFVRAYIEDLQSDPSDTIWVYYSPTQPTSDLPYIRSNPDLIRSDWIFVGASGVFDGAFWLFGELVDQWNTGRVTMARTIYLTQQDAGLWHFTVSGTVERPMTGYSVEYVRGSVRKPLSFAAGKAEWDDDIPAGTSTIILTVSKCALRITKISIERPGAAPIILRFPAGFGVRKSN
ncbi:hypothetical protein JW777_00715 [bacterium]|nr:hypothetical protein [bacterium]